MKRFGYRWRALAPGALVVWLAVGGPSGQASRAWAAGPPCNEGTSGTSGSSLTCTYSSTGAEQSFTVPAGATRITVEAIGASGGGNARGADVSAPLTVTPGSTLYVEVGGSGAVGGTTGTSGPGGFNGGGDGGPGSAGLKDRKSVV